YVVPVLAVIHFTWRVKKDVSEPAAYAIVLGALLLLRLVTYVRARPAVGSRQNSSRRPPNEEDAAPAWGRLDSFSPRQPPWRAPASHHPPEQPAPGARTVHSIARCSASSRCPEDRRERSRSCSVVAARRSSSPASRTSPAASRSPPTTTCGWPASRRRSTAPRRCRSSLAVSSRSTTRSDSGFPGSRLRGRR